jgi:HPt (histidine-containing phosphotransfer) domain-containing protein
MKSAAANCGLTEISECAKELEAAGKNEDTAVIDEKTPMFIKLLEDYLLKHSYVNSKTFAEHDDENIPPLLSALKNACGDYDESEAVKLIRNIRTLPHTKETASLLDTAEAHILHSEFEEASELFS